MAESRESDRPTVYDPLRRKEVALTPEEGVRQGIVRHLIDKLGYPPELMGNEVSLRVGKLSRRCDTLVVAPDQSPLMIIEYKAPSIRLSDAVLEQIYRYNSVLRVPVLVITNGRSIYAYLVGYDGKETRLLSRLPSYPELLTLTRRDCI
nr:type I restriction enzyme HsdR N-terminal domain-containing protein [uncultured Porphyromonas sp.]